MHIRTTFSGSRLCAYYSQTGKGLHSWGPEVYNYVCGDGILTPKMAVKRPGGEGERRGRNVEFQTNFV
jgi:hypothetical protein